MIITKHVFKRCLDKANSIDLSKYTEEEGHKRIKLLFLEYEIHRHTKEELTELLIAEGMALAEITADMDSQKVK